MITKLKILPGWHVKFNLLKCTKCYCACLDMLFPVSEVQS